MKKQKMVQIISILIIFAFIVLLFFLFSGPKKIKNKEETVAILIEVVPVKAGFDGKYEFFVRGQRYETHDICYESFIIGDKFIIGYNKKNPKENGVFLSKPIFLKNEETIKSLGKVLGVSRLGEKLTFSYYYQGNEYKRTQRLPSNNKLKKIVIPFFISVFFSQSELS